MDPQRERMKEELEAERSAARGHDEADRGRDAPRAWSRSAPR